MIGDASQPANGAAPLSAALLEANQRQALLVEPAEEAHGKHEINEIKPRAPK